MNPLFGDAITFVVDSAALLGSAAAIAGGITSGAWTLVKGLTNYLEKKDLNHEAVVSRMIDRLDENTKGLTRVDDRLEAIGDHIQGCGFRNPRPAAAGSPSG